MDKIVSIYRKEHFNAAHRLFNPGWTAERNAAVFGKCSNPHFHGHNYELVVKVTGPVLPETGYVMDMKVLSDLVQDQVVELLDHKNLNVDVPYFSTVNPTAENICIYIFDILRASLPEKLELQVRLYETERNYVEFPAN